MVTTSQPSLPACTPQAADTHESDVSEGRSGFMEEQRNAQAQEQHKCAESENPSQTQAQHVCEGMPRKRRGMRFTTGGCDVFRLLEL